MKLRIITGVTAAILVILLDTLGSFPFILSVVLIFSLLAFLEYDRLFFPTRSVSRQLPTAVLIVLSILSIRLGVYASWIALWMSFIIIGVGQVFVADRQDDFPASVRQVSLQWMGYIYIVGLLGFILPIVQGMPKGRAYLLLLFFLVFIGDTSAYFVGSRWGRHRLAPHISPKKSVEGAIAATLSAPVVALVWLRITGGLSQESVYIWHILIMSPFVSLLAQAGDLFESILKRSQSRKDSGHLFPGHGGILDRIDGLALSAPFFYFYLVNIVGR